jgi:outer membrane lipoprotein SlyB
MIILRNKNYSDKEPTIRIGHWNNKKKFSELTDKQLRNIANYENKSHPGYKKVIKDLATVGGISGAAVKGFMAEDRILKNSVKGATIGTILGAGAGAALSYGGHKLHTKHVKYAKDELAKREKRKNKEN